MPYEEVYKTLQLSPCSPLHTKKQYEFLEKCEHKTKKAYEIVRDVKVLEVKTLDHISMLHGGSGVFNEVY